MLTVCVAGGGGRRLNAHCVCDEEKSKTTQSGGDGHKIITVIVAGFGGWRGWGGGGFHIGDLNLHGVGWDLGDQRWGICG